MDRFVVTISRAYGSGGHSIGKRLAELLDIPCYDREIVELTAQKYDLDEARLDEMEDQSRAPMRFTFQNGDPLADTNDRLFIRQSETVIALSEKPCVIVGRCADYVLRDHPNRYSFFIYSGLTERLAHMKREKGIYRAADPVREIEKMDRRRAAYYKYHTGQTWGAPCNYSLCVDSSILGMRTAELLEQFIRMRQQAQIMQKG